MVAECIQCAVHCNADLTRVGIKTPSNFCDEGKQDSCTDSLKVTIELREVVNRFGDNVWIAPSHTEPVYAQNSLDLKTKSQSLVTVSTVNTRARERASNALCGSRGLTF